MHSILQIGISQNTCTNVSIRSVFQNQVTYNVYAGVQQLHMAISPCKDSWKMEEQFCQ